MAASVFADMFLHGSKSLVSHLNINHLRGVIRTWAAVNDQRWSLHLAVLQRDSPACVQNLGSGLLLKDIKPADNIGIFPINH
jgi:hypothetical protein